MRNVIFIFYLVILNLSTVLYFGNHSMVIYIRVGNVCRQNIGSKF